MWASVAWLWLLAGSTIALSTSSHNSGVVRANMSSLAITEDDDHLAPRRAVQTSIETITETVPITVCTCDLETSTPSTTATTSYSISTSSQVITSTTLTSASLAPTTDAKIQTATTTLIDESTVTETLTSTSTIDGSSTTQISTVTMMSTSETISTTILTPETTTSTTRAVLTATTTSILTTSITVTPTSITTGLTPPTTASVSTVTTVSGSLTTLAASTITTVTTDPLITETLPHGTTTLPASTVTATINYPATVPDSTTTETFYTAATEITTGPGTAQARSTSVTTTGSPSVCPTLISNPTYTPASPLPTDYTWGCPPGYLCKPPHTGDRAHCNVEAGLPAASYVCSPSECIVSPPLVSEQGADASDNQYNVSKEYYNLDPDDFGLSYAIFKDSKESNAATPKRDMITLDGSGISLWNIFGNRKIKRDTSDIPGVCYNECNDAALEPQEIGKIHELCESDSAFMVELGNCKTCITTYASSPSTAWSQKLLPSFAQFLDYCSGLAINSTSSAVDTTSLSTTTSVGATETSVLSTGGSTSINDEASTSTTSTSIQFSEKTATTTFDALTGTITQSSEGSNTTEITNTATTDSITTGSTQIGETTSSAWATRLATLRTVSETGSMVSKSGAENPGAQVENTSTDKPRTTGDVSINAEIQTDTASASVSAPVFDNPIFAVGSANDVPRVGLLSFLLVMILSLV